MALVLVTGASTGLGLRTATQLVDAGAEVVLHARSADRLAGVPLATRARGTVFADLSDARQVSALAGQLADYGRFDAVVHNAGVIEGPVFAVNLVAPWLLTAGMTPPRRAIVLSSSMHRSGSADLSGLDLDRPGDRRRPYDDSKLLLTALALGLARRQPGTLWHAVDPGWVPTRMGGAGAPDDLEEGCRTQAWLATAREDDLDPRTGGYWHHRHTQEPAPAAADPGFQDAVIELLGDHTGVRLR